MAIKVGIYGYGNLGKGVECAIKQNDDFELVGIFSRRAPESVKTIFNSNVFSASDILSFKDKIFSANLLIVVPFLNGS
jgi:diaminopimelate dehydrogenase